MTDIKYIKDLSKKKGLSLREITKKSPDIILEPSGNILIRRTGLNLLLKGQKKL